MKLVKYASPNYEELLDEASRELMRKYIQVYDDLRRKCPDKKLRQYIELNDLPAIEECSNLFLISSSLFATWLTQYRKAASAINQHIVTATHNNHFVFDEHAPDAVKDINSARAWMERIINESINHSLQSALSLSVSQTMADRKNFIRVSMGLSQNQVNTLNRYRSLVLARNKAALDSDFRNKRYDNKITDGLITPEQLRLAINTYGLNLMKYQAHQLGELAASEAVYQAGESVINQAIIAGVLLETGVRRDWHHRGDSKVRNSHRAMGGQRRGLHQPFISGLGNLLNHPRDRRAPASDVMGCRCWMSYHFNT